MGFLHRLVVDLVETRFSILSSSACGLRALTRSSSPPVLLNTALPILLTKMAVESLGWECSYFLRLESSGGTVSVPGGGNESLGLASDSRERERLSEPGAGACGSPASTMKHHHVPSWQSSFWSQVTPVASVPDSC